MTKYNGKIWKKSKYLLFCTKVTWMITWSLIQRLILFAKGGILNTHHFNISSYSRNTGKLVLLVTKNALLPLSFSFSLKDFLLQNAALQNIRNRTKQYDQNCTIHIKSDM